MPPKVCLVAEFVGSGMKPIFPPFLRSQFAAQVPRHPSLLLVRFGSTVVLLVHLTHPPPLAQWPPLLVPLQPLHKHPLLPLVRFGSHRVLLVRLRCPPSLAQCTMLSWTPQVSVQLSQPCSQLQPQSPLLPKQPRCPQLCHLHPLSLFRTIGVWPTAVNRRLMSFSKAYGLVYLILGEFFLFSSVSAAHYLIFPREEVRPLVTRIPGNVHSSFATRREAERA